MAAAPGKYKISNEENVKLAKWIDSRAIDVKMRLKYSKKQHGDGAKIYHKNCDGITRALTIAYSKIGTVFGGYSTIELSAEGSWKHDKNAFLFNLRTDNKPSPTVFKCKTKDKDKKLFYGLHNYLTYGPTFGPEDSISMTLMGHQINDKGEEIQIKPKIELSGKYFDKVEGLCENDPELVEIQVYEVITVRTLLEDPWRKEFHKWDDKAAAELRQQILDYRPYDFLGLEQVNSILIGPIRAGKSSFFNTVNSTMQKHITGQAMAGSANHSLTTQFRRYNVRERRGGDPLRFRLCDTMGLEDEHGMEPSDFKTILDGFLRDKAQLSGNAEIGPGHACFNKDPTLDDRMHVAVILLDAASISIIGGGIKYKLVKTKEFISNKGIPILVILTKVDMICQDVEEDLTTVYHSVEVQEAVKTTSELMGIPPNQIMIMKNYESETDNELSVDILTLVTLRQMLRLADGFLDDEWDRQLLTNPNVGPKSSKSSQACAAEAVQSEKSKLCDEMYNKRSDLE